MLICYPSGFCGCALHVLNKEYVKIVACSESGGFPVALVVKNLPANSADVRDKG